MNILLALTSLLVVVGPPQGGCTAVRAALPAVSACAVTPHGVTLAATQARAEELAAAATAGENRFRRSFGKEPAAYAVFDFDQPSQIASTRTALKQIGYAITLPTPSPEMRGAQMARAAASLPPGVSAGAVVSTTRPGASAGEPRDDTNFVPHELGHLWYEAAFWNGAPRAPDNRYGSPGPDWLDEAAAMLMENDASAQARRQQFADGRRNDPERLASLTPEIPLRDLITMAHPVTASLPKTMTEDTGPILIVGKPSLFYAQGHVFAEYLIDRSGDPRILASLSEGFRAGDAFGDWLAREGRRHRLPSTLAALEADWRTWLDSRYGPTL